MPDSPKTTGIGFHTNTPVGGKDAARIAAEFKEHQKKRHQEILAERKARRDAKKKPK